MRTVFLALLLVFFQADALSKNGGKGAGSHAGAPAAGSSSHSSGGGGGGMNHRIDPRNVPPLAAERRVHEQDCSKPVDWASGNVKCK